MAARGAQAALALLLLNAGSAWALCLDGRRPTVEAEFAASAVVAVGSVVAETKRVAPEDPDGFEETVYRLRPSRVFKGPAKDDIELHSENTSSRFEMQRGRSYLVFVQDERGERFVDACGNSGPLRMRRAMLGKLGTIAGKAR
jgi:hypothetical protein